MYAMITEQMFDLKREGLYLAECNFSRIYKVMDRYMSRGYGNSQVTKVVAMYYDLLDTWPSLDFGQVSKWINGKQALSSSIAEHYKEEEKRRRLPTDIRDHLFPMLVDRKNVAHDLYSLVIQDDSLSMEKREELTREYDIDSDDRIEFFLADLFYFAACRPHVPLKGSAEKLAGGMGALSPDAGERIRCMQPPLPVRHFTGRTQELLSLHNLLVDQKAVFLHGIAGIGKSELSRRYAKEYRKTYTNILYMTYRGDLKKDICSMNFTDDVPGEDDSRRFERHDRYLKSLKGDTLLIIDNFDTSEDREPFLSEIMCYSCRLLFTSRYIWEDYPSMELYEMEDDEDLMDLVKAVYPEAGLDPVPVERIIDSVHRHTLSVELAARLMARGVLTPEELLIRLEEAPSIPDSADKIRIRKDGRVKKETYQDHIRILFGLFALDEEKQKCLGNLSMMPVKGIGAKRFAQLAGYDDLNQVNDLAEMGLIHEDIRGMILLHPLIRERIYEDIRPDDIMCEQLCENLRIRSSLQGTDISWYYEVDEMISNILTHMNKNRWDFYLRFLQDVFFHAEKYDNREEKQKILTEMKTALEKNKTSTREDMAMYYDYLAGTCGNTLRAIALSQKAVKTLPTNTKNVLLKINIYSNLFTHYVQGGQIEKGMYWCRKVNSLYEIYPDWRDHNWLVFRINQGILFLTIRQYLPAMKIFEDCRQYMIEADMEGTQDYAVLSQYLGILYYKLGSSDKARKIWEDGSRIYDKLYQEDPAKAEEQQAGINGLKRVMEEREKERRKISVSADYQRSDK